MNWLANITHDFSNFWQRKTLFYARRTIYAPHTPVAEPNNDLDRMIYAVNPVYLEISPENEADTGKEDRLWLYLLTIPMPLVVYGIWIAIALVVADEDHLTAAIYSIILLSTFVPFLTAGLMAIWYWLARCCHPVEYLIRFDRKRQMVLCMPRKPFEIDFTPFEERRTLAIHWRDIRLATCQYKYAPINAYRGQLLVVDVQEEVLYAIDIIRLTSQEFARRPLETIRRYMEEDYDAVIDSIRPQRWRRFCRPNWREMFSWAGIYPNSLHYPGSFYVGGEWLSHLLTIVLAPYIFYAFFMNWLMGAISPAPIWKKSVREMHEADLAKLGVDKYGAPVPEIPLQPEQSRSKEEAQQLDLESRQARARAQRLDKLLAVMATVIAFIPIVWFAEIVATYHGTDEIAAKIPAPFSIAHLQMILVSGFAAMLAHLSKDLKEKISPNETYWIPATPLPSKPKANNPNSEENTSNQEANTLNQ
jgi:hypothetical protein